MLDLAEQHVQIFEDSFVRDESYWKINVDSRYTNAITHIHTSILLHYILGARTPIIIFSLLVDLSLDRYFLFWGRVWGCMSRLISCHLTIATGERVLLNFCAR